MPQIVHDIPLFDLDSPEFERFADRVTWPERDPTRAGQFTPALKTFAIPPGDKVDLSVFYANPEQPPQPSSQCDRHLDSEELFITLRGNWVIALGDQGSGPEALPQAPDFQAFLVREGDAFVQRAAVWHAGFWPADPTPATFLMVLSGHRSDTSGATVDHSIRPFADDGAVFPGALGARLRAAE